MKAWKWPFWLELCALTLLALVISNALTFLVAEEVRARSVRSERLGAIEDRLSALINLLGQLPEEKWAGLFKIASVRHERVSLTARPAVALDALRDGDAETRLRRAFVALGSIEPTPSIRVAMRGRPRLNLLGSKRSGGLERFDVAVSMGPRRWLNAEFFWQDSDALLPGLIFSALVSMLALIVLAGWIAIRLGAPLRKLDLASRMMQAGKAVEPLAPSGPSIVREAVYSFNNMAQRLMPLVDSQRAVLASVGHDLKTPITSLRLKTEFIEDDDLKHEFVGSLDELQAMTDAALSVAKNGVTAEEMREIDVSSLVESLCHEQISLGHLAEYRKMSPNLVMCRPQEIRRAARNLIENAIKYGGGAHVEVTRPGRRIVIAVHDDGPGIRQEHFDRAFEPFVRLNQFTRADEKGQGLGLTLARAIARAHGGDVVLRNREPHGFCAELSIRV